VTKEGTDDDKGEEVGEDLEEPEEDENVEAVAVHGEHNEDGEDSNVQAEDDDLDLCRVFDDRHQSTPAAHAPRVGRTPEKSADRDNCNKLERMRAMMRNMMKD
jgi:hypothetical protein